jgi:peptidoglycan LD-endopeptidase LytH
MKTPHVVRGQIVLGMVACLYGGAAAGWWAHAHISAPDVTAERRTAAATPAATEGQESTRPTIAPATRDAILELRSRRLRLPLEGVNVALMRGQFAERRGSGSRGHEAVDLLAPRGTPVHAVDSGRIAKLFRSKAGGITIYQFDQSGRFSYYYAHLDRYASGLREGQPIDSGDVIGYVGTTGNAPANTPHLHFAIFELTSEKHWWQGTPLDPYAVFGGS